MVETLWYHGDWYLWYHTIDFSSMVLHFDFI